MKIVIPGDPIPKARARTTKKGFAYDPQYEIKQRVISFLKKEIIEKYGNENGCGLFDLGDAFEVNWYFYMPIPKSFSQIKANACKWGLIEHTSKPDRSNLEKFYEDCANGILWKDDSQITKGQIIKKYCNDDKPRTEIYMTAIKPPDKDTGDIVSLFSPEEISTLCYDASLINMNYGKIAELSKFLSKLADLHGPKFTKINKKYPGHWKKLDTNSNFI